MSYTCIDSQTVLKTDGTKAYRCLVLSTEDPASDPLTLTGADVSGLNNNDVIAAGSLLISPGANYIAFGDGSFSEKEGGSGGGGYHFGWGTPTVHTVAANTAATTAQCFDYFYEDQVLTFDFAVLMDGPTQNGQIVTMTGTGCQIHNGGESVDNKSFGTAAAVLVEGSKYLLLSL